MRTKIIATIGPASRSHEVLSRLVNAGVGIFRLNFSHGDASMFVELIGLLRELERESGRPLTILQDLSGPKIRIGEIAKGALSVSKGDTRLPLAGPLLEHPVFPVSQFLQFQVCRIRGRGSSRHVKPQDPSALTSLPLPLHFPNLPRLVLYINTVPRVFNCT